MNYLEQKTVKKDEMTAKLVKEKIKGYYLRHVLNMTSAEKREIEKKLNRYNKADSFSSTLKKQMSVLLLEKDKLKKEVENIEQEKALIEKKLSDLKIETRKETEEFKEALDKALRSLNFSTKESVKLQENLGFLFNKLQEERAERKRENDELEDKISDVNKSLTYSTGKTVELQEKLSLLYKKLLSEREEHSLEKEELKRDINKVKRSLEYSTENVIRYQEELKQLHRMFIKEKDAQDHEIYVLKNTIAESERNLFNLIEKKRKLEKKYGNTERVNKYKKLIKSLGNAIKKERERQREVIRTVETQKRLSEMKRKLVEHEKISEKYQELVNVYKEMLSGEKMKARGNNVVIRKAYQALKDLRRQVNEGKEISKKYEELLANQKRADMEKKTARENIEKSLQKEYVWESIQPGLIKFIKKYPISVSDYEQRRKAVGSLLHEISENYTADQLTLLYDAAVDLEIRELQVQGQTIVDLHDVVRYVKNTPYFKFHSDYLHGNEMRITPRNLGDYMNTVSTLFADKINNVLGTDISKDAMGYAFGLFFNAGVPGAASLRDAINAAVILNEIGNLPDPPSVNKF